MRAINNSLTLSEARRNTKVFYGTLTPVDWDNSERPIEFSLYTYEEEDILLGSPHLKKKYQRLLNCPVEVTGIKKINDFGDEYLHVKKIRRIRNPESKFISQRIRIDESLKEYQEYSAQIGFKDFQVPEINALISSF